MNQFTKALIIQDAYGESTDALRFATAIASADSEFKVLDIQPVLSEFWHELIEEEFEETPSYHRHQKLRELVQGFEFGAAKVSTQVNRGRPVVQIVQTVLAEDYRFVVKEAQEKVSDYLFGSLDFRLLRHCPIPLLLIHPTVPIRPERILVAINPEAEDEEVALNQQLIIAASSFAQHFHCKLAVVAAYETPRSMPGYAADSQLLKRLEKHEKEYRRRCRAALDAIVQFSLKPIKPDNVYLESGRPAEVIVGVVEQYQPDLIVIGSVARQGLSGMLMGNTAERVLRSVRFSVLAVKPAGFRSPLA